MISLQNDYSEGDHPRILTLLSETNRVQSAGYGEDAYCLQAASDIKQHLQAPQAAIHFVSGGTQSKGIRHSVKTKTSDNISADHTRSC